MHCSGHIKCPLVNSVPCCPIYPPAQPHSIKLSPTLSPNCSHKSSAPCKDLVPPCPSPWTLSHPTYTTVSPRLPSWASTFHSSSHHPSNSQASFAHDPFFSQSSYTPFHPHGSPPPCSAPNILCHSCSHRPLVLMTSVHPLMTSGNLFPDVRRGRARAAGGSYCPAPDCFPHHSMSVTGFHLLPPQTQNQPVGENLLQLLAVPRPRKTNSSLPLIVICCNE